MTGSAQARERLDEAVRAGVGRDELQKVVDEAVREAAPYGIDPDYPYLMKDLTKGLPNTSPGESRP